MRRPVVIDVNHKLPFRSSPLSVETVAHIFGGCLGLLSPCAAAADCCSGSCLALGWPINNSVCAA
jgi:hypothetical protein